MYKKKYLSIIMTLLLHMQCNTANASDLLGEILVLGSRLSRPTHSPMPVLDLYTAQQIATTSLVAGTAVANTLDDTSRVMDEYGDDMVAPIRLLDDELADIFESMLVVNTATRAVVDEKNRDTNILKTAARLADHAFGMHRRNKITQTTDPEEIRRYEKEIRMSNTFRRNQVRACQTLERERDAAFEFQRRRENERRRFEEARQRENEREERSSVRDEPRESSSYPWPTGGHRLGEN